MVLSTLTVTNLTDSPSFKAGDGSLRGEIAAAQSGDTIQFSSTLAGGTINLTDGTLQINKSLSIVGQTAAGAPDITINAGGKSRVFAIEGGSAGINVTLQNLTITGGTASDGAGLLISDRAGTVTLNNLDITSNQAAGAAGVNGGSPAMNTPASGGGAGQAGLGGGVYFVGGNAGTLVITNSTLQSNVASGGNGGQGGFGGLNTSGIGSGTGTGGLGGAGGSAEGGGLYISGGSLQLSNDRIVNNSALGGQGGMGGAGGVKASNHNAFGGIGGRGALASGGGIYAANASVQMSGGLLSGNIARAGNGGIGGLGGRVEPSALAGNLGSGMGGYASGGGVYVTDGSVQISTGAIQNNAVTGGSNPLSSLSGPNAGGGYARGGGLYVASSSLIIGSSTLSGNAAHGGSANSMPGSALGGALYNLAGDAQLLNDTIALNSVMGGSASKGVVLGSNAVAGAIFLLQGDLRLINDTIAKNSALNSQGPNGTFFPAHGGGLVNDLGSVEMANTIIALNTASTYDPDISGTINSSSHDLIDNASDTSGSYTPGLGDLIGVTPNLAPLGNYGGPTQTMPLLPGSPGIDAGANSFQGPATVPGLVDWWRGNGNANDSAGPNNGTVYGGVSYPQGVSGQAFSFDGKLGSYVDLGTGPDIVGIGGFTISVWIRTTTDGTIISQRDPSNFNGEYALSVLGGKINWSVYGDNQSGFNFSSNRSVNDGNWHLITVTRLPNTGTGQLYIDGKLDSSSQGVLVPLISGVHVYLGEDVRDAVDGGPSYANNFTGQMDEVQIYNQVLTAGQIQSLAAPSYGATGLGVAGEWPTTLPGLVSWLPGENTFADASGSNPGTPVGGVSFTQGKVGQAFQFDGSTGQINIADSPSLDSSSFSVGGWFQLTQAPAVGTVADLASKYDGNYHGWILSVGSNLLTTLTVSSSSANSLSVTSSTPLALNQWYYVTATFDGSTATLYINGKAVGSGTMSGSYTPTSTPLTLGAASWANGDHLAGKVDEFVVYNRALNPSEVSLLSTPITTDQRGGARMVGPSVDIGATEYQYDLAVTGNAPATAAPGSTITYSLTVTNNGLDAVPNVTLTDTLPAGVTYQSLSVPTGWTLGQLSGQTITATSAAGLAPGASATFTLTVTVNSSTAGGTTLTNSVSVSPTTDDSTTANNTLTLTTTAGIAQPSDPGFELPHVGTGSSAYAYDPSTSPWTFTSSAGVSGNTSAFTSGNPAAPQGTQVAFLQDTGTVSQAVTFAAGSYTISVYAAQRGNANNGGQTFAIKVDGNVVGTITPSGTSYVQYTSNAFTVTAGSHTIAFVGLNPKGGDNTAFLDQVSIQTAPVGVDIHGQPHNAQAGQSIGPVTVAVVDGNGNTIPNTRIAVTLSIYSGPKGGVLEGATTVWSVNGVATFSNLVLNKAGTYVLEATSGKLTPDISNAIAISPRDVSQEVKVQEGTVHRKQGSSDIFEQTVTITNTSKEAFHGPLALLLTGLPSGVTLQDASGHYQGSPYVDLFGAKGSLAPGQKVTITLSFLVTGLKDPDDLSYSSKVLLGI